MWEGIDVVLQKHEAKHIYKVPEGLRELCSDISREVLRSQPTQIFQFIADYVNALLITRENTKVALQVVNNILRGSEAIVNILFQTRLTLDQIVAVAPRVQKAFREYLDSLDEHEDQVCEDFTCDEKSKILLQNILETNGVSEKQANRAATVIQAAFRGHYERMKLNEAKGLIMWQRAVGNTLDILKKAGVPEAEIVKSAPLIQFAYRGYYTRRNIKIKESCQPDEELKLEDVIEPRDTLQAVAWLDMLFEESGLTIERANEAASIIQRAYRRYRVKKQFEPVAQVESTRSMVVEAILDIIRQRVFETVMSRTDLPTEHGNQAEMEQAGLKLQILYKEHIRQSRLSIEDSPPEKVDKHDDKEQSEEEEVSAIPMEEKIQKIEEKPKDIAAEKQETTETELKAHVEIGPEDTTSELVDKVEKHVDHDQPEDQPEEQQELKLYEGDVQDDVEEMAQDQEKSRGDEQHKEQDRKNSLEQEHKEGDPEKSHDQEHEEQSGTKSHEE